MQDNPNYSYISTARTPDGGTHYLKDAEARNAITAAEERIGENAQDIADIKEAIRGGTHFIGVTATELTDGCTTNPIVIDGVNVTAKAGDFTIRNKVVEGAVTGLEFIWTGAKWSELGSTGTLKALAFKDAASGTVKPTGTVSKPTAAVTPQTAAIAHLTVAVDAETETLTIGSATHTVMTGVAVDVSQPTFTGDTKTVTVS